MAANGDKRDFREIVIPILPDTDPSCAGKPAVRIVAKLFEQIDSEFDFEVKPLRGLADIARVEWSFGDGSTRDGGPSVSHGYRDRPQSASASSFIVTADVVDKNGVQARVRTSVTLPNLHYMVRSMAGQRPLPTAEQRMVAADGSQRLVATFTNLEDKPVRFRQAQVRLRACAKSGEVKEQRIAVGDLLENAELTPGQASDVRVKLPAAWSSPEYCSVDISLSGDTVPSSLGEPTGDRGLPAQEITADLSFALGMPKSVENGGDPEYASQPVTDPALKARLLEVMAHKGTNMISEEDLRAAR